MTVSERFVLAIGLTCAGVGLTVNDQFWGGMPLELTALWLVMTARTAAQNKGGDSAA